MKSNCFQTNLETLEERDVLSPIIGGTDLPTVDPVYNDLLNQQMMILMSYPTPTAIPVELQTFRPDQLFYLRPIQPDVVRDMINTYVPINPFAPTYSLDDYYNYMERMELFNQQANP